MYYLLQLVPSPVSAPPYRPAQTYPMPLSDATEPVDTDQVPVEPALQTQHQQEQHSIGGFFRKLFKLDDKKKDKRKDAPETIREADDSGLHAHLCFQSKIIKVKLELLWVISLFA